MGGHRVFAHYGCVHNELVSLKGRVLGPVPLPTAVGLDALRAQAKRISRLIGRLSPWSLQRVVEHYSGAKRARYQRALVDLHSHGFHRRHARVKAFVKFEKIAFTDDKINPDPRMIQWRHPVYGLCLAQYTKPIEHALYRLVGKGKILPPFRCIGKGLSSPERAMLARKMWCSFDNPVCFTLDASRFDQHCSRELLQIEHAIYARAIPELEFQRLLSYQLDNRGTTSAGIRYKARGKRMSGDMNTALGNCVLMVLMVSAAMRGKKYAILDDGDDILLFTERKLEPWVRGNLKEIFLTYGHKLKLEGVYHSFPSIVWCQSSPIHYAPGKWKFVRHWQSVMMKAIGGTKYFNATTRPRLVKTVGLAELILNLGVPVLQEYALALLRNAGGNTKTLHLDSSDSYYYRVGREMKHFRNQDWVEKVSQGKFEGSLPTRPIHPEARWSFYLAFGVSITEQVHMERLLRGWSFPMGGCVDQVEQIDVARWQQRWVYAPDVTPLWE